VSLVEAPVAEDHVMVEEQSTQGFEGSAARPGALEVEGLTLVYKDRRKRQEFEVFANLGFSIGHAEFVSVVGPSGCGKSSLLYCLAGLVTPTRGEVRVDGRVVREPSPDRGVVFQDFALFPWLSVEDNIAFGIRALPAREREQRVSDLVEMVDLGHSRRKLPHELSGGMKQRVAIASTLATNPSVLLMDEPFGALDAQTRENLQSQLADLHQKTKKTTVFVTHDIREAVVLSDRVLVMGARPGAIVAALDLRGLGTPRDELSPAFAEAARQIKSYISSGTKGRP
jgi:NitT/TauT family transport system ATP-binding protein